MDFAELVIRARPPRDGCVLIEVAGDLDMPASFRLEPELERHIGVEGVSRVVLDLGGVEFVDSSGLGTLLSARQRAHDLGVELTVSNPSEVVRRVLEMTGTTQLLDDG